MTPAHRVLGAINWLLRGLSGPPMNRGPVVVGVFVVGLIVYGIGYWFGWWK